MALTKVSGGILDPGINVAGIVTATGFDGPFTGGSSKNITAGIVTATSLDLNGNGDISGNLVIGGNLTANGDFTTLNTTLREVELLRVDANSNTVAAGIITQTGSGDILRLYDGTSQVVTVLDTGEVGIGITSPSDKLHVVGSGRFIKTSNNYVHVGSSNAGGAAIVLDGDSNGDGIGADYAYIEHDTSGDLNIVVDNPANAGNLKFFTNTSSERLRITSGGDLRLGLDSVANVTDSAHYIMTLTGKSGQTGAGAIAFRDPSANTDGFIFADSGNLFITADYDNTTADSSIRFRVDGSSEKLRITSGGQVSISGAGTTFGNNTLLNIAPANRTTAFDASDGDTWHDVVIKQGASATTNSVGIAFEVSPSAYHKNAGTGIVAIKDGNNFDYGTHLAFVTRPHTAVAEERVRITSGGNVGIGTDSPLTELHVHGETFTDLTIHSERTSGNIGGLNFRKGGNPSGIMTAQYIVNVHGSHLFYSQGTERLRVNSDGEVRIPSGSNTTSKLTLGGAIDIYHDGNTKFENTTGYLKLMSVNKLYIDGDELFFRNEGGTNRWRILTTGHLVPGAAGTYDIGSTSAEVGHIYVADSKTIWIGSDQDLRIAHDPTHTVSYIQNTGTFQIQTDDLRLYNFSTADLYLRATTNAAVQLYYDSSTHATPKLETSATGIEVHGEVAASQDYPNFRPTLDLNFAAEKKLDSGITYSRTGPASFVNKFGKVVLVGDNAPRFDHDPTTRESKGILIEESRTNQMKYSSDITDNGSQNSGYTVTNGTVTGNQTTAPDGTTTADQFACNTTNSLHRVSIYFSSGQISNSTAYTFSVFVKANGYDKLHIRYGGYNADNHGLGYDLSDGTTFAGRFDGTGLLSGVTSSSMIAYPNGWYRCTFTFTTASDAATGSAGIFYYISNSESTTNFAGDGSSGMYFWGAQMEVGSFPTSYIPTNGRTVTRGDESLKMDGEDFSNFYNETEGTVITQHEILKNQTNMGLVTFSKDFGSAERIEARATASNTGNARFEVVTGSSSIVSMGGPQHNGIGVGKNNKYAFAFKKDDFTATLNGVNSESDTSGNMPTGINSLLIGDAVYAVRSSLYIKTIIYYPKRLPDSQLVTLTS